jgi:hypothetical protein
LKVLKNIKKSKVEALFGGLVNKNGYKYMQCGDLELIVCILHLNTWLSNHCHDQRYSLQEEGESCFELGLVCNLGEKRIGS